MAQRMLDTEVVVVGAGPTGLMLANCLAKLGISVVIIDGKSEPTRESRALVVSAQTGEGMDKLRALVEASLPQPDVALDLLVPYTRGDLVSRIHSEGSVDQLEHTAEGTRVTARVHGDLAGDLTPYQVAAAQ